MDARAALRQRIRDELCHLPWAVAQRLLTKAFDAWPELDAGARQALRDELDAAIAEAAPAPTPMPAQMPAVAPGPPPTPAPARFDPRRIDDFIADALHAPTDGSARRFEVLCDRARYQLELALAESQVGWFDRWRLRRQLEAGLRAERGRLVGAPRA